MNNEHSIKDKILSEIHSGHVAMRPKIYFTLQVMALVFVALATLAVSIFIFNFIVFSIRIQSQDALLGFGPRGWEIFLMSFPWSFLLLDTGLVLVLQWLIRQFRVGYAIPTLYVVGGLFVATTVFGFAVDRTTFNDRVYERHGRGLPPFVGGLYEGAHRPPPMGSGVCHCTIVSIEGNVITVADNRNTTTTLTLILPPNDPRATTTGLKIGDTIFIAGDEEDGTIRVFGIRRDLSAPH